MTRQLSDRNIRPCPDCGMPRYRHRAGTAWQWTRCGSCEVFNGYTGAVLASWDDQRTRQGGWS